jgi:tetrameric-type glycyl-tRNA synthetase alpha subunit
VPPAKPNSLTFQELILRLQAFWAERGCVLQQPYDVEVGAGTMAPETFLRVLGPKPYKVAYVQPSRRPADGRYGENPNRLFKHMQLQVILKPPPENVQELYLESLAAIGIDLRQHDIKFEEDNWEAPTLSAWGVGWQVMLDGLEITQFTYFQQCGGVDLFPISAELTYGLERIGAFLQDVDSIYDIVWARDPENGNATTYGDVRLADELQFSVYNFEAADVEKTWKHFDLYEAECKSLIRAPLFWYSVGPDSIVWAWQEMVLQSITGRIVRITAGTHTELNLAPGQRYKFLLLQGNDNSLSLEVERLDRKPTARDLPFFVVAHTVLKDETGWANVEGSLGRSASLLAAYDLCLKCSHLFNILDARGAISVTERVGVIARVRALAVGVGKAWVDQQKSESAAPDAKSDEEEPVRQKKPKKEALSPVGS